MVSPVRGNHRRFQAETPLMALFKFAEPALSFLHGVAFLSWNQHPEPTGSRRATPLLLFQHSAGQSPTPLACILLARTLHAMARWSRSVSDGRLDIWVGKHLLIAASAYAFLFFDQMQPAAIW